MRFTKMHGCGNDYLVIDAMPESAEDVRGLDFGALAPAMCDRRRGVGADGLIVISPSSRADVGMRIVNADGSEGDMCGNGLRCVAKRVAETVDAPVDALRIQALHRVVEATIERDDDRVVGATVDMGEPLLDLREIGVDPDRLDERGGEGLEHQVAGLPAIFVSMGNPHMVAFLDEDLDDWDLASVGPEVERHRAFPQRMNLQLARVLARDEVRVRTWERGAGATLACGTGACAALVAGVLAGHLDRSATVRMPGGDLRVAWDEPTGRVSLSGPAETVFDGDWPVAGA